MSFQISIDDFDMRIFEPLAVLFGSYFPSDDKLLTKDYTEWLYGKNPYGLAKMVKAVEGTQLVGFMAMIPVRLSSHKSEVLAYYVVNVLVHPQHQGKYIFGKLISAAKELVNAENAVLMGHPNDMALKQWQRSRMQFHESFKPSLVLPKLFSKRTKAVKVEHSSQLSDLIGLFQLQVQQSERLQIFITDEYIKWRFFLHPTNNYLIQIIEVNDKPVGFIITKRVRFCFNLLVDKFILDRYVVDGLGCLPWVSISFSSELSRQDLSRSLWPLPIKKSLPFFFTSYNQVFLSTDLIDLGLSASDF